MIGRIAEYVADVQSDASDLAEPAEVKLALESNYFRSLNAHLAGWQAHHQDKIDGLSVYSIDGTMQATARTNRSLVGMAAANGNSDVIQNVSLTGQSALGQPLRSRTWGLPIMLLQPAPNSRVSLIDNTTGG